jgi:hypothetical protein
VRQVACGQADTTNVIGVTSQHKNVTYPVTDAECSYDDVALLNAQILQLLLMVKEQRETDQIAAY